MSRKQLMKNALYSTHKLFEKASDLSFASKADYESMTKSFVKELHAQGFPISNIKDLKQKNVTMLIESWQAKSLSPATIKNRLSVLRYVAGKIGKETILPKINSDLNIGAREYIPKINKAIFDAPIHKVKDPHVQLSMRLQQEFGLRREESLKFIVSKADKGTHIELQASWTKGGIRRIVPIETDSQRQLLNEIKAIVPKGYSLIPQDKTYKQQRSYYDYCAREIGLKNLHGLRHAYAQSRYEHLANQETKGSGWKCPYQGGIRYRDMTALQREIDQKVRFTISNELGHSRMGIVKVYCG